MAYNRNKRRLHWLGHATRMQDGRLPKEILYGELATGSRPTGRPTLRYKDVLKRDLKAGGIAPAGFEALAADRSGWRYTTESAIKTAEQKREKQWEEKRAHRRQRAEMTTSSHAATVTGSAVRGSASTATAGAAALPRTEIYGRKLHCLPRQTDANSTIETAFWCQVYFLITPSISEHCSVARAITCTLIIKHGHQRRR